MNPRSSGHACAWRRATASYYAAARPTDASSASWRRTPLTSGARSSPGTRSDRGLELPRRAQLPDHLGQLRRQLGRPPSASLAGQGLHDPRGAAGTSGETFTELMDHVAQGQDVAELLAGNRDRGHCAVAAARGDDPPGLGQCAGVRDAALMPGKLSASNVGAQAGRSAPAENCRRICRDSLSLRSTTQSLAMFGPACGYRRGKRHRTDAGALRCAQVHRPVGSVLAALTRPSGRPGRSCPVVAGRGARLPAGPALRRPAARCRRASGRSAPPGRPRTWG